MVRNNNNATRRSLRALQLIAALALFAVSCGGSGEASSAVASLADVEEPQPDIAATPADIPEVEEPLDDASEAESTEIADAAPEIADPADQGPATEEEMALDFVACMRDAGMEMADPTVNADGSVQLIGPGGAQQLNQPGFQEAAEGCTYLIEDATFFNEAPDLSEIEDSLLEFAQCLRGEGLDVTDPDMTNLTAGPAAIFGSSFDPQDPANSDAIAACSEFLPNAGGG